MRRGNIGGDTDGFEGGLCHLGIESHLDCANRDCAAICNTEKSLSWLEEHILGIVLFWYLYQ